MTCVLRVTVQVDAGALRARGGACASACARSATPAARQGRDRRKVVWFKGMAEAKHEAQQQDGEHWRRNLLCYNLLEEAAIQFPA